MTNEENQALIENIKSVIDEYEQFGGGGLDEQVYRIALASMMANPVAYTDMEQLTELSKSTFAEMYSPDDSFKSDPEWIPLFTCPAPAINLAELAPDGWKLVPVEPTTEMLEEIWLDERFKEVAMKRRYQALLAAAPSPHE